jgi:acetyl-CoA synthetase
VVCAVVAAPGETADAALADVLAAAVVAGLGPPFRPSRVVFVSDLPKTRNMKTMRRVVRAAITGDPAGDLTALVNPEAVDELRRAVAGG